MILNQERPMELSGTGRRIYGSFLVIQTMEVRKQTGHYICPQDERTPILLASVIDWSTAGAIRRKHPRAVKSRISEEEEHRTRGQLAGHLGLHVCLRVSSAPMSPQQGSVGVCYIQFTASFSRAHMHSPGEGQPLKNCTSFFIY